ncbi:MAG: hypothetical protein NT169_26715 [Chloroflexi bacterium]|nr:hypothetical protein [Chloroflexota bacterium]
MDVFYQTVATFSFTLLGLWWGVLQLRHDEWINDPARKRLAYSVHLAFLTPGVMSLAAQVAGDVKIIWRATFVLAAVLGAIATVLLIRGSTGRETPAGWFTRFGRWLTAGLYVLVAVFAFEPTLANLFGGGMKALQVEGLLLTLLVFLGVNVAWEFLAQPKS